MTAWLIDKSALTRLGASVEAQEWVTRINRGLVAISTVTLLEVGYSARSSIELSAALGNPPISDMPVEYLAPAIEDRAIEVQRLLAQRGAYFAAVATSGCQQLAGGRMHAFGDDDHIEVKLYDTAR